MSIKGRPLKLIVDDLERLRKESQQWYRDNVQQRLVACETLEAGKEILGEISLQCCADDGTVRDMPAEIHIPVLMKIREFAR